MSDVERREALRQFVNRWKDGGDEKQDCHTYWLDLLQKVLGVDNAQDYILFEKPVKLPEGDGKIHTRYIDGYIPDVKVLIEQKGSKHPLDEKEPQSGGELLTPYEQAKRYNDNLPLSEKARWIVSCNFTEIWVYNMEDTVPAPEKIAVADLQEKYSLLEFLVEAKVDKIAREMEVSVKAGEFVGLIYDALLKQYLDPKSVRSLESLNMLCVRLVFCLYAEDAHLFGDSGHMFHDYMAQFSVDDMRKGLIELFKVLDTPEEGRDPYDKSLLSEFPYVNGGLFAEEDIEIPNFTEEIRDILLAKASEGFDWSQISPTIFGAVFESTLNPETRRSGGMHYTSIENIHKVIDPLFLDGLKVELEEIKNVQVRKTRKQKLLAFQDKLSSLTWLDPACGSGNFLTETYISIRRLENEVLGALHRGQMVFSWDNPGQSPIKVGIHQFYGIEINDFAVTVAKTALWIAESQMLKETEDLLMMRIDFLPLKTNAHIVEGNALRLDWGEIVSKERLNYIMGNPPFHGFTFMTDEQKKDMSVLFPGVKNLDFVCGWFKKASDYIVGTNIQCAFVSTNSIVQGETVERFWSFLPNDVINFAYRTFVWDSEASIKARVHCVIIGFSKKATEYKYLFDGTGKHIVSHINRYLFDGEDILVKSRNTPLCNVPKMIYGNKPADGGYLIIEDEDLNDFLQRDPLSKPYIKPLLGAAEYIKGKNRWCLWLVGADPAEMKKCPLVMERVKKCRESREQSISEGIRKFAVTPTLFAQRTQPTDTDFIVVPRVSSKNRRYVPIGFINAGTIVTDRVQIIPNATLYEFGIIISNVHMAWMRTTCMRLKSDYSYSKDVVYNNYVWPTPTDAQKAKIEGTAQAILDARALYPGSSLADLYDPLTMPPELQKAHHANDIAVMEAYGFVKGSPEYSSEPACVAALMKMYQKLVEKEGK